MNKLKLNKNKTKVMEINLNSEEIFEINDTIIEKPEYIKYLGFIINKKKLNFNEQIDICIILLRCFILTSLTISVVMAFCCSLVFFLVNIGSNK